MRLFVDCFGRRVRLTDERRAHFLEHPEMADVGEKLGVTLGQPEIARLSRTDPAVRLFYLFLPETIVGGKWLCVVVKYTEADAFVITAYLTDKPKAGEDLWPKR